MSKKHILVVDDHREIRDLLSTYLQQHGYSVSQAEGGEQMRALLQESGADIDLVVLDLMMPGEDGLSLCRFVRESGGPPVIMLTAMSEDADCVVGLEMGADDFVTKPFVPRVLLARIKAVLRRPQHGAGTGTDAGEQAEELRFSGWRFNSDQRHLISADGLVVPLSNTEYILLKVFLENPKRVLSRDQILTLTKGREADAFDRSIDNQVSRLRKKLEQDPQHPTLIKTVWGGGYMFTGTVES